MTSRTQIYGGLLYVVLCWSLNTVLLKGALPQIGSLPFMAIRFMIMPPLAFLLMRLSGERIRIHMRDLPILIACGACGYGVYQYLWVFGLAHTTAFASSLLSGFTPLFTLVVVALLGQEQVRGGRWFGAMLALVGIAIFEGFFSGHAGIRIGDILTLIGAAIFAGYNVLSAKLLKSYSPISVVTITMCIGAIMIVPSGIVPLLHTDYTHISWQTWAIIGYSSLFPILLTYPVWTWAIGKIGAAQVSLFLYLTPVGSGLLSLPLLHTTISGYEIVGAAICIGGMILANLPGGTSVTEWWSSRTLGIER